MELLDVKECKSFKIFNKSKFKIELDDGGEVGDGEIKRKSLTFPLDEKNTPTLCLWMQVKIDDHEFWLFYGYSIQ